MEENELKHILLVHSRSVTDKALALAKKHPELDLDLNFIEEAAMLHDIGIFLTDAPDIQCFGTHPYNSSVYLPWLFGGGFGEERRLSAPCFGMRTAYGGRAFVAGY